MKSQVLRIRTVGLLAIGVLFLTSVLHLTQLSTAGAVCGHIATTACLHQPLDGKDRVDVWRGLAMASLYLVFCLRPRRPAQDEGDYAIHR